MKTLTFRKAVPSDLTELLVLEQKIIDAERPFDPFLKDRDITYYDLEKLILDDDSHLLVAESANKLIACGYAQLRESKVIYTHSRHCYLGFIFVDEDFRGHRLAQSIIDLLIKWGESNEVKHFQLDVYDANESAIRAYEKAGFTKATVKMERMT